jgi:hypothetical protein
MKISCSLLSALLLGALFSPGTRAASNTNEVWALVFSDSGSNDWKSNWFLEGAKASVANSATGMVFTAGPVEAKDAGHAVLWTKPSFAGDIKIEYDYTRLDSMTRATAVNILYLQATGLETEKSPKDIFLSTAQRQVPSMDSYFNHMNALHISYACTGPQRANYVAARRYPARKPLGFKGTEVLPVYENVDLFKPGETWHLTAVKEGHHLAFTARHGEETHTFEWNTSAFPPVTEGRIGFRHMWARSSLYQNVKVYTKK